MTVSALLRWSHDGAGSLASASQKGMLSGARGDWVILPSNGADSHWNLVALDAEGLRRGREVVTAFVGPTAGHIEPSWSDGQLASDDGEVIAVQIVRVVVDDPTRFVRAVERLIGVRHSQPGQLRSAPKMLAHMVRDFRLAVHGADGRRAEQLLRDLREDGRLSQQNIDFLEVELLASQERWRELRNLAWFVQLAIVPRPVQTTISMLEAVWRAEFGEAAAVDPGEADRRFKELPDGLHALLDAIDVPPNPAGQRLAALRSLDQGSETRLERIKAAASPDVRAWIDSLQFPGDDTSSMGPEARAKSMYVAGRFRDVVELAQAEPENLTIVELAVRSTAELDDAHCAAAIAPLLTEDVRRTLPQSPLFLWAQERVLALGSGTCSSWAEWFDRVAGPDRWDDAATVVRLQGETWSAKEFEVSAVSLRAADSLGRALSGPNSEVIDYSADQLCALAARLAATPGGSGLVDAVLYALMDRPSTETLASAILELVQEVLRAGSSAARYGDLVDVCSSENGLLTARVCIPVLLDLLDEFAMRPCPDQAKRGEFAAASYEALRAHAGRGNLDETDALLATSLFEELGVAVGDLWIPGASRAEVQVVPIDQWGKLEGKSVALYTLMDGIGDRFRQRLLALCPSVDVVVLADHVGSDSLRSAAQGADYLIVDTRHAKHAATVAIDAIRPKGEQILPEGKGVTSFLRALLAQIQDSGSET